MQPLRWKNLHRKHKNARTLAINRSATPPTTKKQESRTTIAQLDTHVEQQHLTSSNKKMQIKEKTGEEKEQAHRRRQKKNVNNHEQKEEFPAKSHNKSRSAKSHIPGNETHNIESQWSKYQICYPGPSRYKSNEKYPTIVPNSKSTNNAGRSRGRLVVGHEGSKKYLGVVLS